MKIDMISTTINNLSSVNNKGKGGVEFSSKLKEVDNTSFDSKCEDEVDNEDELLQLMNMLINNLSINHMLDDNSAEMLNSPKGIKNTKLDGIESILNNEEIFTALKNLNLNNNSKNISPLISDFFNLRDINLSNDEINLINTKLKELSDETTSNIELVELSSDEIDLLNTKLEELSDEVTSDIEVIDLSNIKTILNGEKSSINFNDMNLTNNEINLINTKLNEITNQITASTKEELDESSSIVNTKNNIGNNLFKSIENILKYSLNKEDSNKNSKDSNVLNIESVFNNRLKQIEYVEDTNVDKDKDLLLKISNLDSSSMYDNKDIEITDDNLNIFNSIYKLESNSNLDSSAVQPTEIRANYVIEDIGQVVKYIKINNIEGLTLKINPKELGELTIKLIKDNEGSKVIIISASDETFNLINENLKDIKNHLSNLDVKVNQVYVETKSFVENSFSGELNQQFNKNTTKEERKNTFKDRVVLEEDKEQISEDTNINLLA